MTKTCQDCKKPYETTAKDHCSKRCLACRRNQQAEYKRQWALVAFKVCECGNPATKIFRGEKCCDRCEAIDKARYIAERERIQRRNDREQAEKDASAGWSIIGRALEGKFSATNDFNEFGLL
jgi:endogenous inhibitor of DNA gyrase (YacG/DUF329 family)